MLKLKNIVLCSVIAFTTLGCTDYQQQQIDAVQRELTTDSFLVQTVPEFQGYDKIKIQYTGNDTTILTGIEVNKGNCQVPRFNNPIQMKYGDVHQVWLTGCGAENVLRVKILTEDGELEYGF